METGAALWDARLVAYLRYALNGVQSMCFDYVSLVRKVGRCRIDVWVLTLIHDRGIPITWQVIFKVVEILRRLVINEDVAARFVAEMCCGLIAADCVV